jgi:hypothetical protein
MAEGKIEKQFKVYFNGTKKEEIASSGAKFSKFINNVIRPHANVINFFSYKFFYPLDSITQKRV